MIPSIPKLQEDALLNIQWQAKKLPMINVSMGTAMDPEGSDTYVIYRRRISTSVSVRVFVRVSECVSVCVFRRTPSDDWVNYCCHHGGADMSSIDAVVH